MLGTDRKTLVFLSCDHWILIKFTLVNLIKIEQAFFILSSLRSGKIKIEQAFFILSSLRSGKIKIVRDISN